jgi:hypothetical protein
MKALVTAFFATGVSFTMLSSAQAITVTAAPLAAAKEISSVLEVQQNRAGGCERGYQMSPHGCREIRYYRKPAGKKKPASKK